MKILRWMPALLLLIVSGPALAEKVATTPPPTGYIDDYANVLSAPAKSDMEALARELHDKTKAQVFVVTIKTLEGESVETFANELFRKWKIGEKKTDRGVLILFAINDHKDRIEVGYGLEPILNDAKAGDIGREMVPDLQASHYDGAIETGLREVSKVIAADSGVTLDTLSAPAPEQAPAQLADAPAPPPSHPTPKIVWVVFIFMFIAPFVIMAWLITRAVKQSRRTGRPMFGGGGGSSGSDSSSDSSSDDSFSGGDGGDSGGGGASGSW